MQTPMRDALFSSRMTFKRSEEVELLESAQWSTDQSAWHHVEGSMCLCEHMGQETPPALGSSRGAHDWASLGLSDQP